MSDQEETSKETAVTDTAPRVPASNLGSSSAIGRRLKAYYDDVASEPVPDRFLSLLDALDAAETHDRKKDRSAR